MSIWRNALSAEDIAAMANCTSMVQQVMSDDQVLSWGGLSGNGWSAAGKAYVANVSSESLLCPNGSLQKPSYHSHFIHSSKIAYNDFIDACVQLAGQMPLLSEGRTQV